MGVYLADVGLEQGPMEVVPLSAYDELHALADEEGRWTGQLSEAVLQGVPLDAAVPLTGPAGTGVLLHSAAVVGLIVH